jgi:membrane peptidoglycan carboxypeptidase
MGINAMLDVPPTFQGTGLGNSDTKGCPPKTWCVKNAVGYRSPLSMTDALALSPNTAFAKLIQQVGVPRTVDMAVRLGLRSYADPGTARAYVPNSDESLADYVKRENIGSFTLGPFEVNALELSNVAATLASGGMWCPPTPIEKVLDRHGKEVDVPTAKCEQVVPEGLANTLTNALSKDTTMGTAVGAAGSVGWGLPMSGKTGTTESHRSSGFVGYTNQLAAANYVFDDSPKPSALCAFPLRKCGGSGNLYGGTSPAQTWFLAMNPIATNFGPVALPPTDPRYVNGAPGISVPSVLGLNFDTARKRVKDAGFQVSDQPTPVNSTSSKGSVIGTTPTGPVLRGSIITINTSTGIAPAPPVYQAPQFDPGYNNDYNDYVAAPPPPPEAPIEGGPPLDVNVIEIPGLPPITVPVLPPAPPVAPAPEPVQAPPPAPVPEPLPPPPAPEPLPPPPGDLPPP